jgi:hypothetical protein
MNKKIKITSIVAVLYVIAFLFTGKHTNPPVSNTVSWDSPETEATFYRACADCHSNETKWPWYSNFPPVSWAIILHVNEGREHFNISVPKMGHADEAAEEVEFDNMPMGQYRIMHPEALLNDAERTIFVDGLKATFGASKSENHDDDDDGDDERHHN